MNVREATLNDHAPVMALLVHLHSEEAVTEPAGSVTIFQDILNSPHFILLVIENTDEIVGTCYLNIIPNLTRQLSPYGVIENVVTHPAVRGRGFGKALMQAAIDKAFDNGCYKVMLLTGRGENVQAFYKHCGMDGDSKQAFIVRSS